MTPERIKAAVRDGVVFVCATCTKFWRGQDTGKDGCLAAQHGKTCGGPLIGLTYPEYHGPLTGCMTKFCFLCGAQSDAAVQVRDQGLVGVCKKHIPDLESYARKGERPPFVTRKFLPVVKG